MNKSIAICPSATPNLVAVHPSVCRALAEELGRQGIKVVRVYKGVQIIKAFGANAFKGLQRKFEELGYAGPCFAVEVFGDVDDINRLASAMYASRPVEPIVKAEDTPLGKANAAYLEFSRISSELSESIEDEDKHGEKWAKHDLKEMWPEILTTLDKGIEYCRERNLTSDLRVLERCREYVVETMRRFFPELMQQ